MKQSFEEWFATSPLASALRVFVAVVVTLAVTQWVTNGTIDFAAWQTWVIAALASSISPVLRWLNPSDVEFGRGAITFEPFDVWADEEDQ